MANELSITYPVASATVYCIIRRRSDSYVWNGTSFEAWNNANIATYDVAMTDQGGDLYTGDFPTAIAASYYILTYYRQAGASPAITDTVVGRQYVQWDGSTTSAPAPSVTLDTYALTTLTEAKRYLNISASTTTYDDFLTELINAVSQRIENECGRKFKARDFVERYSGNEEKTLLLDNFPILEVTHLAYGDETAIEVEYSGTGIRATIEVNGANVILRSWNSAGTQTENSLALATYPTASTLTTAISAVSSWSATLRYDCLSSNLNPLGGFVVKNPSQSQTAYLTWPDEDLFIYWQDRDRGFIQYDTGNVERGFQNILIEYRAGYETIPYDLNMLCRELVAQIFNNARKDTSVQSERLGDYSYALANQTEITAVMAEKMRRWSRIR